MIDAEDRDIPNRHFVPERWRRIYVASSWRNQQQQEVVESLRWDGHAVYDFKNPGRKSKRVLVGRYRSELENLEPVTVPRRPLKHPISEVGCGNDFAAMKWADTFVLVLPCGRSAHLELGWACGQETDAPAVG